MSDRKLLITPIGIKMANFSMSGFAFISDKILKLIFRYIYVQIYKIEFQGSEES